jgi:protein tyrosine/serine phosphatase
MKLAFQIRKHVRSAILFTILVTFASGCAFLNGNYQAVKQGEFYRSGQLNESAFRRRLAENGARTVVCLRGPAPGEAWFDDERATALDSGADYVVLGWHRDRLLTPEQLTTFIQLVRDSEKPIWVHCQGGVHRASMASAIFRLLEGEPPNAARKELILGFGHPTIGKILELYEDGDKPFDQWAVEDYPRLYDEHPEWHGPD